MKTTVEIPDHLYQQLKVLAAERNTTFRSVLEEALRRLLAEHGRAAAGTIRDASYGGGWLTIEYAEHGWDAIRDTIYEGRGA